MMRHLAICLFTLLIGLPAFVFGVVFGEADSAANQARATACQANVVAGQANPAACQADSTECEVSAAACQKGRAPCADCPRDEKIFKHLQQAAGHLHAAGMDSKAEQLLTLAHMIKRELLVKKLAEVERLQAEIRDLRSATRPGKKVVICMQLATVWHTKLREAGLKPLGIDQDHLPSRYVAIAHGCRDGQASPEPGVEVCEAAAIAKFVAALGREKVLDVVGGTFLIPANGRYSSHGVGIEIPTPVALPDGSAKIELQMLGTRIEAMSTVLTDRKVRLKVHTRTSAVHPAQGVTLGGIALPCRRFHELDTDCELELGKTAVIGGFVSQRFDRFGKDKGPSELLVLMTPELVDAPPPVDRPQADLAPTAQAPAATKKK